MKTILITGVGGGGSNNLINSLRLSNLDFTKYQIIGSNMRPELLAKSPLDKNHLLPPATDKKYAKAIIELIRQEKIDLVVPNNDREVGEISRIRDELPSKTFLPDKKTVETCHDKYKMYDRLRKHDIPLAQTVELKHLDEIDKIMNKIGGDKFWVRPKYGSGSRGATWVDTPEQAKSWISLWETMRGYKASQFTISEYLPGKDYCFQSVWKDGKLLVAKLCQRLAYFGGENTLSGMSSTPSIAKTVFDKKTLDTIHRAIFILDEKPNGNFNFDLKGRADDEMCITECNIGRFCMITPIFDRTGKYNTAEIHVLAGLGELNIEIREPYDIEEDCYMIRDLDTLPVIVSEDKLASYGYKVDINKI